MFQNTKKKFWKGGNQDTKKLLLSFTCYFHGTFVGINFTILYNKFQLGIVSV